MGLRKRLARATVVIVTVSGTILTLTAGANAAARTGGLIAAPADLNAVIDNLRNWLVGLLVGLATLFLTVGGIRLLLAAGDPGEAAKGKECLRNAAIGYSIAALAPLLVEILKKILGV
jgi:Type IV secretion system pilin